MTIVEDRLALLDSLHLESGEHSPDGKFCVMEATAYLAGEPWSAAPKCVSPVITSFLISWNDSLPDADRQMLKPLIPLIIGTKTNAKDETKRAWLATDWLARECAPAFLRCAGLKAQAELLAALAPLTSAASARKAQPTLDKTRAESAAAWAAARDAASAAAWDAASAAARVVARAAARDAARAAASAAASAAAGDALAPTVKVLQASAYQLVLRMIDVGKVAA